MTPETRREATAWLKQALRVIYHKDGLKGLAVVVGLLLLVVGVVVWLDVDVAGVLNLLGL